MSPYIIHQFRSFVGNQKLKKTIITHIEYCKNKWKIVHSIFSDRIVWVFFIQMFNYALNDHIPDISESFSRHTTPSVA